MKYSNMSQLSASLMHLSDELGELSQWLYHDDSIINIVRVLLLLFLIKNFSTFGSKDTDA